MFKISPVQDADLANEYLNMANATPIPCAFVYAMTDTETGELMGISQFEIASEAGYIYDLKPRVGYEDFEAMFILGRQTMNFIDLCGVHACKISESAADLSLIKSIGFKLKDGEYFCNMTGMFDGNCGNHK